MTSRAATEPWVLANEFATVRVSVDRSANGPRLLIEDLGAGRRIALDPFVLAALTRTDADAFDPLMDPGTAPSLPINERNPR